MKSPTDAQNKWAQRIQQSGQYYQQGVSNPNVDWAGKAVAARDRRNAGLQAAIADGRIDAGIQNAGTEKWRQGVLTKGVTAWTTNTPKAANKYGQAMQTVMQDMAGIQSATAQMARTSVEDRIAISAEWQRRLHDAAEARKRAGQR